MHAKFVRFRLPQGIGMFATLTHCVLLCKYCFEAKVYPIFAIENELYGADWFERFFRHRVTPASPREKVEDVRLHDRLEINAFTRGAKEREISNELTSIAEGARLFHHFLAIREEVQEVLDAEAPHRIDPRSVGVHYRGTDKFTLESPVVPFESVFDALVTVVGTDAPVFLATDDGDFFAAMVAHISAERLRYVRQPSGESHYRETGTFGKGLEALTDCWLLSRCSVLVKTPSLLSAWSALFNPQLRVVLVGAPRADAYTEDHALRPRVGYFPENILHAQGSQAGQPPTA